MDPSYHDYVYLLLFVGQFPSAPDVSFVVVKCIFGIPTRGARLLKTTRHISN